MAHIDAMIMKKVPKLFQVGKVGVLEGDAVPEPLTNVAERMKAVLRADGHLQPESGQYVVREVWVSEESPLATCYFARVITSEMIQESTTCKKPEPWQKPTRGSEPPSEELMTTKEVVKLFHMGAFAELDVSKKLTTSVSTQP
ncbi:hypothetical protein BD413DRAFT_608822 [Trametes elegans]|nr:hypothetical protein BD413DRAFT_608822 [Trametes elegans]